VLAKVTDGDPLVPEFEGSAGLDGSPAVRNSALEEAMAAFVGRDEPYLP